jgi:GNAT superfamily N-acetyltransferase
VIRTARPDETEALEELQLRSSMIWDTYRDLLIAYPDVVKLPPGAVEDGRVRVATADGDERLGFSVVLAVVDGVRELDGLFVTPEHMRNGIGRALIDDVAQRARDDGATRLEVTAADAIPFYKQVGFIPGEQTQTRWGPARRLHLDLAKRSAP